MTILIEQKLEAARRARDAVFTGWIQHHCGWTRDGLTHPLAADSVCSAGALVKGLLKTFGYGCGAEVFGNTVVLHPETTGYEVFEDLLRVIAENDAIFLYGSDCATSLTMWNDHGKRTKQQVEQMFDRLIDHYVDQLFIFETGRIADQIAVQRDREQTAVENIITEALAVAAMEDA